jgi:hypothetical protein
MMISGAISPHIIRPARRKASVSGVSEAAGMFGWTAIQVHANMVTAQLQKISQTLLWSVGSLVSDESVVALEAQRAILVSKAGMVSNCALYRRFWEKWKVVGEG